MSLHGPDCNVSRDQSPQSQCSGPSEGCLSIVSQGYITVCRPHTHLMQGFKRMNPFCIPFAITNMPGAILAMDLGFMGPNYSISTACATGNYCILRLGGAARMSLLH